MRRIFVYGLILACLTLGAGAIGAWSLFQGTQDFTSGGQKGDLALSMTLDKTVILAGEDVDFVFVLKNKGDKNVTFWMGPPFFDAYLYDSNNVLAAKWTDGRAFPPYIEKITLKPGENFSKTIQWNLYSYNQETECFIPVKPGQYRISGVWLGEPHIETSKIDITVKGTGGARALAVIEDEEGNRIAVEPLSDEVWSKLVELFHSGEMMWIGGEVEVFINIQPDEYYRWGFRFKPETITVAEVTAEGLQATIQDISENLDYWLDIGQAYVFAKVTDYFTGDELQVFVQLSSDIITWGENVTISAIVKDDDGNSLEGATVTATIGDLEILFILSDYGNGNYQGTINTSIVNEGTYEIAVTAQKEGYKPDQISLTLTVTSNILGGIEGTVTDSDGNPLVGMRVGIVSGTAFFPEMAVETNEEGYYQIGSVPPGTFEVAVHDRQGNRIGLGSVTVKSGETSTLNFVVEPVPSDVTKFKAVVNEMWSVDVFVCVNISDGLTEKEAELIVGTTFIHVKGEYVTHRLDTLTFNSTEIEAHYTWGINEDDMGHVFDVIADLTTLQITVTHCR